MDSTTPTTKPKPGPKGKVLEPYAAEILLKARQGQSMQDIVNWLAQPPRAVTITRQAVHLWLKARIRKLAKLNATFANTGVGAPFQATGLAEPKLPPVAPTSMAGPSATPSPESRSLLSKVSAVEVTQSRGRHLLRPKVDVSEFMVEEDALERAQNPLRSDPDP